MNNSLETSSKRETRLPVRVVTKSNGMKLQHFSFNWEKDLGKVIFFLLNKSKLLRVIFLAKAHTQSDRICKVVASYAEQVRWTPGTVSTDLYGVRGVQGDATHYGGANSQSIGSTISDASVDSWLWSTATRSCQLGNICRIIPSSW